MSQVFMFDDLEIAISLGQSLATATETKIWFKKPDGTSGSWDARVSGQSLVYNATAGEIDQPGLWQFEAKLRIGGAKRSSGISTQNVDKPLDA